MPTAIATAILGAGASTFAVGLLSFAISYVIASVFAPDPPEPPKDQGVQSRIPADPKNKLPVIYGQARVAGTVVFADISSDNQKMGFLIALSEGPVESIETIWWEDKKLNFPTLDSTLRTPTPVGGIDGSNGGAVDYDGKAHDFLDSDLKISVFPSGGRCSSLESFSSRWNSDAPNRSMPDVAYMYVELTYNRDKSVTGLPSKLYALVNGRTVDSLNTTTNQMEGSQTTASSNPADCLIDYLTNTTYGGSIPLENIDLESMASHKDFCDELKDYTSSFCSFSAAGSAETDTLNSVLINRDDYDNEVRCTQQISDQANFGVWNLAATTSQAKRYTTNGVIRTGEDLDRNISHLTIGNGAAFSYNLGKFGIVSEGVTAQATRDGSPVSFSEDNIIGRITVSSSGFDEKLNELTVKYDSVSQRYQEEQSILEIPEGSSIRGIHEPRLERTMKFNLVNNNVEAVRAGTILLNQSRQSLLASFETDLSNSDLQAGDIVSVSHETPGWTNKLFKVQEVEEKSVQVGMEQVLGVKLTLREYASTDYDDSVIQLTDLAPNTTHLDPFEIPELLFTVTDTSDMNDFNIASVKLGWNDAPYLRRVEFRYFNGTQDPVDPNDWIYGTSAGTSVDIPGLASDSAYQFEMRAYNSTGVIGNWENYSGGTFFTPNTGVMEVELISSDNANIFYEGGADKTITANVYETSDRTLVTDFSPFNFKWNKEGSVACVDNSGNFTGVANLDVQDSQTSCESVGGIWVPGNTPGLNQCTSDGVNTAFADQGGQVLGCSADYRADTEFTGSSHNMRTIIIGSDDIVNVGEFSCTVKRD